MDPRHSGVALTSTCGLRVAVDRVAAGAWAVSQNCRPEGGATAVSTLGVGGSASPVSKHSNKRAGDHLPDARVRA
eukprot:5807753-Prymnesium_polylepis.1